MDEELANVKYFLFVEDVDKPHEVYVASLRDDESPTCLKIHSIVVDWAADEYTNELEMMLQVDTRERSLHPLNWTMKVQDSKHCVPTVFHMKSILHQMDSVFGVWGQKQFDFFRKFVDQVVNVESLILQEVSKFRLNDDLKHSFETVAELFLEILRKIAKDFDTLKTKEGFEYWIGRTAWKSFFRYLETDETMEVDTELAKIKYFVYVENPTENIKLYTATTRGNTLVRHMYVVDKVEAESFEDELNMMTDIDIKEQDFPQLNWRMNVQESIHYMSIEDDLKKTFKKVRGNFGVWGQEQYDYFNGFLNNVVDVEPLLMKAVQLYYGVKEKSNETVTDLFLDILRKRWLKHASTDKDLFETWIREDGWTELLKNCKEDEITKKKKRRCPGCIYISSYSSDEDSLDDV